jgi:hypothetical protein
MDPSVVPAAQQRPVAEVGRSAVGVVDQVMSVAPRSGSSTPWDRACLVAQPESFGLAGREAASALAQVEDMTRTIHYGGKDCRVASDPADCLWGEHRSGGWAADGRSGAHPVTEFVDANGQEELRFSDRRRPLGGGDRSADKVD